MQILDTTPFRRSIAVALAAALLGAGTLAPTAASAQPAPSARATVPQQLRTQAPGFYRMMLGDFEITALSDGTIAIPLDALLHAPREQTRADLSRWHRTLPVETSINAYLVHTGSHLVLIDTGAGSIFGNRGGGQLLRSIRAAGYQPGDIDMVLLTHIHADHSGGLMDGEAMAFPNADIYVDEHDAAYWLTPANADTAPAKDRHVFKEAWDSLGGYARMGRLKTFASGTRIVPGIRAVPQPGHTPGHTRYEVESHGQAIAFWGDIVHAENVQFDRPGVTIRFDVDASRAARARAQALADAAAKGYLVGAAHISFPGIGRVRRDGKNYRWEPVPYSLQGLAVAGGEARR